MTMYNNIVEQIKNNVLVKEAIDKDIALFKDFEILEDEYYGRSVDCDCPSICPECGESLK